MKITASILIAASWWIHSATAAVAFTCDADTYPVGSYTALFVPCQVNFHQSSENVEEQDWGYGCDSLDASGVLLESRPITVLLFPDQCVGDENRCYALENNIQFLNQSLYYLNPPNDTTHITVNCTEDKVAANEFVGDVTDMTSSFIWDLKVFAYTFLLIVIGSIAACIYCCFFCAGPAPRREIHAVATPHYYDEVEMGGVSKR